MCFYDKDGSPISAERFEELHRQESYLRIGSNMIGEWWISTVWLGVDHGFGQTDRPVLFETMVFSKAGAEEYAERYCTEEEARAGHERAVAMVRTLEEVGQP